MVKFESLAQFLIKHLPRPFLPYTPFVQVCCIHLFIWLTISSLSLHNLYLLFFCVLSIFAPITRDSVSILRFLFLSHVFFWETLPVCCSKYLYSCFSSHFFLFCPVGWGCKIYRLLLCRDVTPPNDLFTHLLYLGEDQ